MNKSEVRELLKKRGAGKIDSYLRLTARQRQSQSDLWNLLQIWVHCLLYSRRIYPLEAFQQREVLGIQVQTASSPPLKQYLDEFFNKLKPHLAHINHLKVIILGSRGNIEETNILYIDDLSCLFEEERSEPKESNPLQREMQIKAFLFDFQKQLESSGTAMELEGERSFKLRIGYRHQTNEKQGRELLDGWVVRSKQEEKGQIACSLKTSTLNLIYEIFR